MFTNSRFLAKTSAIKRYLSKTTVDGKKYLEKLRNLGILAHIDAGKTTTTERMLFYSGTIKSMGEVHHGNTVTDYMEQERERGITITSAAVTFNWKNYQFNLIDTPGHIDFTMEVEQTLSVLDGAIVVLDASAGVEAQTITVWRQADRYNIPRIAFVNKMDRLDANLEMCCKSIEAKLDAHPIQLQHPVIENGRFCGIVDLVTLQKTTWDTTKKTLINKILTEKADGALWEQSVKKRHALIDKMSELNDALAEKIIALDSLDHIELGDLISSVRTATLQQKAVPVICGSSYKNIGVQPLMDAAILYLPSPLDRNHHFKSFDDELCGKAFKVIHDKQKGALVFLRLYSGQISKGQRIYNIQKDLNEQIGKIYVPYADDFRETETLQNGNIVVATGLKTCMSGDLIAGNSSVYQKAKSKLSKQHKLTEEEIEEKFGLNAKVPAPVFFCSIEPPSLAAQSGLENALAELQREDPSLRVTQDNETGQTILAGMGELHLEIIRDRILKEYKIEADLGPLQIAYREAPLTQKRLNHIMETKVGNSKHSVSITLSVIPTENIEKGILRLDRTAESASNISAILPRHLQAIKQGIEFALCHGPKIGLQIINTQVMLHNFSVGKGTSDSMISAATSQCVNKLMVDSGTNILEPIMTLEIVTPEDYLSSIMGDLARRRTIIQNVGIRGKNKTVLCKVPLAELLGYSTFLRTISSGTATFAMEFSEYSKMSEVDEHKAIENVRGF